MKTAAITGITGQTGGAIAHKLINEGYEVYGLIRKSSSFNTQRIEDIHNNPNLHLMYGDLADSTSIDNFVKASKPDLFFNMGGFSHVRASFDLAQYVYDIDATGVLRVMQAIEKYSPTTKVLHASTSELFGNAASVQNENTSFMPRSPYAIAKLGAYWTIKNYRERGFFAVNSISFNHESKFRNPTFLPRKCTMSAARISLGLQNELVVGNLLAKRSWNHVNDIIDGMMLILNADEPDDYVIGHNDAISVQDFIEKTFSKLNLDWKSYVKIDPKFYRPTEVDLLQPDATKIKTKLGWTPKYSLDDIINEMLEYDLKLAQQELLIKNAQK